jgi:XTP/dITP diphosphohydrolase
MSELIIGTKNVGKIKELEELLADLPVRLRSLNDFTDAVEPDESGATFSENAILKARSYARQTGLPALADDSGLEVEALGGAPGVLSARYSGAGANDAQRIEKLLREINKTNDPNRRARFVCAMAIADAAGETLFVAEGVCGGIIALKARGAGGFGYDPIFIPDGFSATFGELSGGIKQQISHRARASEKIIQYLRRFYAAAV